MKTSNQVHDHIDMHTIMTDGPGRCPNNPYKPRFFFRNQDNRWVWQMNKRVAIDIHDNPAHWNCDVCGSDFVRSYGEVTDQELGCGVCQDA
jgi:hypothetical protein